MPLGLWNRNVQRQQQQLCLETKRKRRLLRWTQTLRNWKRRSNVLNEGLPSGTGSMNAHVVAVDTTTGRTRMMGDTRASVLRSMHARDDISNMCCVSFSNVRRVFGIAKDTLQLQHHETGHTHFSPFLNFLISIFFVFVFLFWKNIFLTEGRTPIFLAVVCASKSFLSFIHPS